jgi:hypothetical protein
MDLAEMLGRIQAWSARRSRNPKPIGFRQNAGTQIHSRLETGPKKLSLIRHLMRALGFAERRKDKRVRTHGLRAFYSVGSEQVETRIKDISPTGIFLDTDQRWMPGTVVPLTLEQKSLLSKSSRSQVKLWARSVRLSENGVGLTFVPKVINQDKWLEATAKAQALTAKNDAIHVLRLTRAIAFLFRISPSAEGRVLQLVSKDLTRERAERVVEIALLAEDLVESQQCSTRIGLSPSLVLLILKLGVETGEKEMQECWAGLLAMSSLEGADDDTSLSFASLLSKLDLCHLRILIGACTKEIQAQSIPGSACSSDVLCTISEIKAISGTASLARIEWALHDLHDLGLLGRSVRPAQFERLTQANLTPTDLGLALFERFGGLLRLRDFELNYPEAFDQSRSD